MLCLLLLIDQSNEAIENEKKLNYTNVQKLVWSRIYMSLILFLSLEFQDIISYVEKETWGSLFLLIYSEYRIWASDIIFCEVESKNKNKKMEKVQIIKPDIFFDSYNGIDSLLKIENKKSYKSQMFPHIF